MKKKKKIKINIQQELVSEAALVPRLLVRYMQHATRQKRQMRRPHMIDA
jgi:hypothetical protein